MPSPQQEKMILFFSPCASLQLSSAVPEESLSTLVFRVFTLSVSSSILSFKHRTACKRSSSDLWQATRPVTNCCVVSREDSGVDSVERAEDGEGLFEIFLDV